MYTSYNKVPKIVVFIYGIPATGKLTIGRELSKRTGFTLLHNHLILDIIYNLYGWESIEGQKMRETMYFALTKSLINQNKNIIYTHVYQPNYVYPSGISDTLFIAKIKNIAEKNGYIFFPVQLICDNKELLKRVVTPSRKINSKVNTKKDLMEWLSNEDYTIPLKFPFNITINNTNISPIKAANMIIKNIPFSSHS